MMDMMEDRNSEVYQTQPQTALESARLNFIKDAALSLQTVITTVAANAQAKMGDQKIEEIFKISFDHFCSSLNPKRPDIPFYNNSTLKIGRISN